MQDKCKCDRGWATVTYMSNEEAETAVALEDGTDDPFPGAVRNLHVKLAGVPMTEIEGSVFEPRPSDQKGNS